MKINLILRRKELWNPLLQFVRHNPFKPPFLHFLTNLPCPQVSELQNGVKVVTEERHSPYSCVGLYIEGGSRYESNFENGLVHFFQHVVFKGTCYRSKSDLENHMMGSAAKFHCFTERELVGYTAECFSRHVPMALTVLIEGVFFNLLCEQDIEEQKRIAYEEMEAHEQDYKTLCRDYLHSTAFQGTPLGQTVIGPSSNLYNFNTDTIRRYISREFSPKRVCVVAVGEVKHDHILSLANAGLAELRNDDSVVVPYVYRYTGSEVRFRDDAVPKANVAIAFEGPSLSNKDNVVMDVAANYLSGWDRSQGGGANSTTRLARACFNEGLCDTYEGFNISYSDVSLWGIHFVSSSIALEDMLFNITDEFMHLCNIVTDGELQRARREMKSKILLRASNVLSTCHDLGRYTLIAGCPPSTLERLSAVDGVTADKLKTVFNHYVYDRCPAVAAVGPSEGLPEYTRIRAGMYWLRL